MKQSTRQRKATKTPGLVLTTSNDGRPYAKINILTDWTIPGDIHLPFHDPVAVDKAVFKNLHNGVGQEGGLFITGDLIDYYWLSSWPKDGKTVMSAGHKATKNALLNFVRDVEFCYEHVAYGCGNHEERLTAMCRKFPGFDGEWYWLFQDVLPASWYKLPHAYRAELPQKTPNGLPIVIEHGDKALYGGVPSADKLATGYPGQCTIIGHNHRVEQVAKTKWKQGIATTSLAFTCGHLSDIVKNNYAANPNWQQGYTTVSSGGLVRNTILIGGKEI